MVRFSRGTDASPNTFYDRAKMEVRQSAAELVRQVVEKRGPGGYWLIGNEPEGAGQDDTGLSDAAAKMYRQAVDFIKIYDPRAKFIVGGWYSLKTNDNQNWVRTLKNKWPIFGRGGSSLCNDITGFHFHGYAFPNSTTGEYDLNYWKNLIDTGLDFLLGSEMCPGKEIWITEYGSLNGDKNDPASVRALSRAMEGMTNYLELNRYVTRYAWFYAIDGGASVENWLPGLFSAEGEIKPLGITYMGLGDEPCSATTLTPRPTNTPHATLTPTLTPTPSLAFERFCPGGTAAAGSNKCQAGFADANCDGIIDIEDFGIWKNEYLDYRRGSFTRSTWEADLNCDRVVDINDFSRWRNKWVR